MAKKGKKGKIPYRHVSVASQGTSAVRNSAQAAGAVGLSLAEFDEKLAEFSLLIYPGNSLTTQAKCMLLLGVLRQWCATGQYADLKLLQAAHPTVSLSSAGLFLRKHGLAEGKLCKLLLNDPLWRLLPLGTDTPNVMFAQLETDMLLQLGIEHRVAASVLKAVTDAGDSSAAQINGAAVPAANLPAAGQQVAAAVPAIPSVSLPAAVQQGNVAAAEPSIIQLPTVAGNTTHHPAPIQPPAAMPSSSLATSQATFTCQASSSAKQAGEVYTEAKHVVHGFYASDEPLHHLKHLVVDAMLLQASRTGQLSLDKQIHSDWGTIRTALHIAGKEQQQLESLIHHDPYLHLSHNGSSQQITLDLDRLAAQPQQTDPQNVAHSYAYLLTASLTAQVIDRPGPQFTRMLAHIKAAGICAMDVEYNHGPSDRLSSISIITLLAPRQLSEHRPLFSEDQVYVIDLIDTSNIAKCTELLARIKQLLEDESVMKVMHDCRSDGNQLQDCAYMTKQLDANAANIIDTQQLYRAVQTLEQSSDHPTVRQHPSKLPPGPPGISLKDLLSEFDVKLSKTKPVGAFSTRPLSPGALTYAIKDVQYLLPLACWLQAKVDPITRASLLVKAMT